MAFRKTICLWELVLNCNIDAEEVIDRRVFWLQCQGDTDETHPLRGLYRCHWFIPIDIKVGIKTYHPGELIIHPEILRIARRVLARRSKLNRGVLSVCRLKGASEKKQICWRWSQNAFVLGKLLQSVPVLANLRIAKVLPPRVIIRQLSKGRSSHRRPRASDL